MSTQSIESKHEIIDVITEISRLQRVYKVQYSKNGFQDSQETNKCVAKADGEIGGGDANTMDGNGRGSERYKHCFNGMR